MERRLAALSKCKELDLGLCLVVHMAIRFGVHSYVCWYGYHIPFPLDLSELLESDVFSFQYRISVCMYMCVYCVCVYVCLAHVVLGGCFLCIAWQSSQLCHLKNVFMKVCQALHLPR